MYTLRIVTEVKDHNGVVKETMQENLFLGSWYKVIRKSWAPANFKSIVDNHKSDTEGVVAIVVYKRDGISALHFVNDDMMRYFVMSSDGRTFEKL